MEYDELAGPGLGTTFAGDLRQRIAFALTALGTNLVADSRGYIELASSAVGTNLVTDVSENTDLAGYWILQKSLGAGCAGSVSFPCAARAARSCFSVST
jgi:hypothetical protein